jgi:hypothetical protein
MLDHRALLHFGCSWIIALSSACTPVAAQEHRQVSGIWPHLAMFNDENECGVGAVVVIDEFEVPPGRPVTHEFPPAWSAYWLRLRTNIACVATAQLRYR